MTPEPSKMYCKVSTESQFLLSSTDTPDKQATARVNQQEKINILDRDTLLQSYPALQTGAALITSSLEKLDIYDIFGTMVIRIDPADGNKNERNGIAIAETIDNICIQEKGWWGLVDPDLFVCFFPDKNDQACFNTADTLRRRIKKVTDLTVSIGIAAYPTSMYNRDQILNNGYKALDHAGFFGPDSRVIFDDISLNISGDHLFQKGDITGAMEEFASALLLEPANVNVHNSLGVCHSLLGDFDRATVEFQTALKLAPDEFMAQYNMGLVHMLQDNRPIALTHFLEAKRLGGDVYEVALQTGRLYLDMNNPRKSLEYINKALHQKPTSLAHRLLGDCQSALGKMEDAATAYKQAIKQNPNDADALSALGLLYESKGENPEIATLFCEKSVEIAPEDGRYRHRLGKLYFKLNRLNDARSAFIAAIERGYDASRYIEEIDTQQAVGE